jgi:DNA (cytosine-5)-methyltransferase 1
MDELALFAGAGGGILGGRLLGWRVRCAVELDAYARRVLLARQADGSLPRFPIWDDIRTFDGKPWRGHIDVVSGGFPCQDISVAGRGAGLAGERSGLWWEMHRIIREVGPQFVFVENVAAVANRGLDAVLGSLADIGFDAEWSCLSAEAVGAPHRRQRLWLVAYPNSQRQLQQSRTQQKEWRWFSDGSQAMADADGPRLALRQSQQEHADKKLETAQRSGARFGWWATEPDVGRVADGVASRMDRLRTLGNGQVPEVARTAWNLLLERLRAPRHHATPRAITDTR